MLRSLPVYILLPPALFCYYIGFTADCVHEFSARRNGTTWVSGEFNLTCLNGKITVANCITEGGAVVPLGARDYQVNGIEYSCLDDYAVVESSGEGSGELISGTEPFFESEKAKPAILEEEDVDCEQQTDYLKEHFLISCRTNKVVACVDMFGDTLTGGYFLLENYSLKFCKIYKNGRRARIENKGCFNGTEDDDVEDVNLHIPKYAVWRSEWMDNAVVDFLKKNIKWEHIRDHIEELSSVPHVAGSLNNELVADVIARKWKQAGLEDVHFLNYNVLLSSPNFREPNSISILDSNGKTTFKSTGRTPVVFPEQQHAFGADIDWVAYSDEGEVSADVVYCNFGLLFRPCRYRPKRNCCRRCIS
ncbi:hypothetical protein QR680_003022 [Steinernema hermaphroditum]|uniref:Uncharacterized protein n=1 Tax=Steinernema hermaphroditum TaxID=289476 RepID=A0AA39H580_9BILA|nr:hypothetical protein QR680_003022 [Steinernema hermaphroditum]